MTFCSEDDRFVFRPTGPISPISLFSKTISRGPAVFYGFDRDGFGNYPSRKAIVDQARMYDGDNVGETFHNLYLGDTIWAAAISAEFSLRDPRKDTARPLVELLC